MISCKTVEEDDTDSVLLTNDLFPIDYDSNKFVKASLGKIGSRQEIKSTNETSNGHQ